MENGSLKNCLTLSEIKQFIILKQQQVKIIDFRSKEEYDQYHIPGAIHLELTNRFGAKRSGALKPECFLRTQY